MVIAEAGGPFDVGDTIAAQPATAPNGNAPAHAPPHNDAPNEHATSATPSPSSHQIYPNQTEMP